jgi:GNAT superfamily N-acetyltransferase
VEIRPAEFPRDVEAVRSLFREYAEGLGIDLSFQEFEAELAFLPGKYAPPAGRLLIAWEGGAAVGCVALRPLQGDACEMKRLYVRPIARGEQLGRQLALRVCQEARAIGYARLLLDTLASMSAARGLYLSLGFQSTEAYVFNPLPDAMYLALDL